MDQVDTQKEAPASLASLAIEVEMEDTIGIAVATGAVVVWPESSRVLSSWASSWLAVSWAAQCRPRRLSWAQSWQVLVPSPGRAADSVQPLWKR
jgi:hypothetical protein